MIKTMTAISLRPDANADDFWRYHIGEHADEAKHLGDPFKYSISRVIDVFEGQPGFFDMVEFWWESREALAKRDGSMPAASSMEDFRRRGGMNNYRSVVEEKRIATAAELPATPLPKGIYKLMAAYRPAAGADAEEFWRFLTGARATAIVALGGTKLRRLSLNRLKEKLVGEPTFFAIEELWFDGKPAAQDYLARAKAAGGVDAALRARAVVEYVVGLEEAEIPLAGKSWF